MLSIKSVMNPVVYQRFILFWFFINLMASFACSPVDNRDHYHFHTLFTFIFYSTLIILPIAIITLLTRKTFTIEKDRIIYKYPFAKSKTEYSLSDIIDFKWSDKDLQRQTTRGKQSIRVKNDCIEIYFKNNDLITIRFDEYQNFDTIRKYLFDYCIEHKIITIRPLEERNRSHFRR